MNSALGTQKVELGEQRRVETEGESEREDVWKERIHQSLDLVRTLNVKMCLSLRKGMCLMKWSRLTRGMV